MSGAPNAIGLCIGARGGGRIGAVIIFQLGVGDGNGGIAGILNQLIGCVLATVREDDGTIAADVCAAFGGVHGADACIHGAVDLDFGIDLIRGGTGIGLAGGIGNRNKGFVRATTEIAPLVGIVNVNIVAAAQRTGGTRVNNDLGAGLHGNILIDRNVAAVQVNGQVAVDG